MIDRLLLVLSKASLKRKLFFLLSFLLLVGPLVAITYLNYRELDRELTESTFSQRKSIAFLGATLVEERLSRLTDIGTSFATRVQFRAFVGEGQWDEAIKILEGVPKDFPAIDRLFLADPTGTLMADTPALPGVKGKNFSQRDWYVGVSKEWKPFVSEVYKRTAEPQYNVIAVAVPIKNNGQQVLGILVLQIKLDDLLEWVRSIEVGESGFVYMVDRKGHLVIHPAYSPQGEIIDYSTVPTVQKVLKGEKGITTSFNPIENVERIVAYQPVPKYGWGVLVVQPTNTALAARNTILSRMIGVSFLLLLINILFVYSVLRIMSVINAYRQRDKIFLESIGDGVVAIDRAWNIASWNKAASDLTGWPSEEALGRPFREIVKFIREEDKQENITFIEEAMLQGKVRFMEGHTFLIKKNGSEIAVGDSAAPIFDERGRVSGAIIVFRDISKEHELEKAREEFTSLATHQLRTPITVIKGNTAMLMNKSYGSLEEKQQELLKDIQEANSTLLQLVNGMLNVSRIDQGTIAVEPQLLQLTDLADQTIKEFSTQASQKKIELQHHYDSELPVINVDPNLILAVFRNLVSNAIKYTPPGGKVEVAIAKQPTDLLIEVRDSGYGIPKDQQTRIFTKFFRASNVSRSQIEGTGLGLYVVRSVIEQAGGKIWFESVEDKGTTFFITLPLEGMKPKEGLKGLT